MNGISVIACGQTGQSGLCGAYGRENRTGQKYIVISRQNGKKRAAGMNSDALFISEQVSEQKSAGTAQDRPAGRSADRKKGQRALCSRRTEQKTGQSGSRRSGRISGRGRRSHFAVRTLLLAVIFAGMLAGFQMMTRASSREKERNYKYYTAVTIGYGEDLSDIVYRYCDSREYKNADDYVREICDINSLPYHKGQVPDLHAGTKIVIPYYSPELK